MSRSFLALFLILISSSVFTSASSLDESSFKKTLCHGRSKYGCPQKVINPVCGYSPTPQCAEDVCHQYKTYNNPCLACFKRSVAYYFPGPCPKELADRVYI